jgi:hypothetical protein
LLELQDNNKEAQAREDGGKDGKIHEAERISNAAPKTCKIARQVSSAATSSFQKYFKNFVVIYLILDVIYIG